MRLSLRLCNTPVGRGLCVLQQSGHPSGQVSQPEGGFPGSGGRQERDQGPREIPEPIPAGLCISSPGSLRTASMGSWQLRASEGATSREEQPVGPRQGVPERQETGSQRDPADAAATPGVPPWRHSHGGPRARGALGFARYVFPGPGQGSPLCSEGGAGVWGVSQDRARQVLRRADGPAGLLAGGPSAGQLHPQAAEAASARQQREHRRHGP